MIILSVEKYKGAVYEISLDDGRKLFLHQDITADFGIRKGVEITEELLCEIAAASERRRARERALYLLDYRDYSYRELFEKLSVNYDEDTCFFTVNRLAELGLIDDRRYAGNLARKYIEVKKYGLYRAENEMCRRGLDRELVREIISSYEEGTVERICELIKKKYSGSLDDIDKVRKMKNALVRQGYSFDDINQAVRLLECEDDLN